jgi:hypothetical protein
MIWRCKPAIYRTLSTWVTQGGTSWHVPEPEAMGVVLRGRLSTQRLVITNATTPREARKTRLLERATLFPL